MTTGHVFIATSLDGFVARQNHQLDWLLKQNSEGEEHGYDAFINSVDGLVMGRGTYEKVLSFDPWPYEKPVIVMSNTLMDPDIPEYLHNKVIITRQNPKEVMESLEYKGWKRVYVDGGKIVQSFIREDLIEDIILTTVPILIGTGISLFGEINRDIDLVLEWSKSYKSGFVKSKYRLVY